MNTMHLGFALLLLTAACGSDDNSSPGGKSDDPGHGGGGAGAGGTGGPGGASGTGGVGGTGGTGGGTALPPPPETWQEHWFEHVQLLKLADYNDTVAIYVDDDVDRATTGWLTPWATEVWRYTTQTYGNFGADRLYMIFHQGKYSGGHPATYFDESHDFRNVSDCGPGAWAEGPDTAAIPSHEVGHIVEGASAGVAGSPAFRIWGDSKWAEFYQYDLFLGIGDDVTAARLYDRFINGTDTFPRAGTHWFKDWFYPLWRDHGHAEVMARFFQLLAQHFPKNGDRYARDMNWGEYVHFTSGAAGTDLKPLAEAAFGWPQERNAELDQARRDFPGITY